MAQERNRLSLLAISLRHAKPAVHRLFPDHLIKKPNQLYDVLVDKNNEEKLNQTRLNVEKLTNKLKGISDKNIFDRVGLEDSIKVLEALFPETYKINKNELNDFLGIMKEIKTNKRIDEKNYGKYFRKMKKALLSLGVDHLEIEKMHTKMNFKRSLYWLLEDYLRPVLQKLYPKVYNVNDTLRETYDKFVDIEDERKDVNLFIEIFEKIDNVKYKIKEEEYNDLFRKAKEVIVDYVFHLPDSIDAIDMEYINRDYYTRKLLLQCQHVIQSFIPVQYRTKESLLKVISDHKLFDEEMIEEIKKTSKEYEDEDFLNSSIIPTIVEKCFLKKDDEIDFPSVRETTAKQRWQNMKKLRFQIITTYGTWVTVQKSVYEDFKKKFKDLCLCEKEGKCRWKPDKFVVNNKPTLDYYNILNDNLMLEERNQKKYIIEVSKVEYNLWKQLIESFKRKFPHGSNSEEFQALELRVKRYNWMKRAFSVIFLSENFGMYKLLSVISRRNSDDGITRRIKRLLNEINEDFAKQRYEALASKTEEREISMKNLLKELLLDLGNPMKNNNNFNSVEKTQFFNFYIEQIVEKYSGSFHQQQTKETMSTSVQIKDIPREIKEFLKKMISNQEPVAKLLVMSHGNIKKPAEENSSINKYQRKNIDSVTLYPPWGCKLGASAAAAILAGIILSSNDQNDQNDQPDQIHPGKMNYKNIDNNTLNNCVYLHDGNPLRPVNVREMNTEFNIIKQDDDNQQYRGVPDVKLFSINENDKIYGVAKILSDTIHGCGVKEVVMFDMLSKISVILTISLEQLMSLMSDFITALQLDNKLIELHAPCLEKHAKSLIVRVL